MGNSASRSVGYKELRSSIPGSLVHEEDYKLFYSLCKVESQRTISALLQPSASQLFYVVIAGEVVAQLSCPNVKSVTATTFTVGETIHFFNAPLKGHTTLPTFEYSEFGECMRNGDIKLAFSFRSQPKETARVIGIDRRGMDEFLLKAKSNVYALASFLNISMVTLFQSSPFFRTMTVEQACLFGPLLKVRMAHTGREVGAHIPPSAMRPIDSPQQKRTDGSPNSTAGERDDAQQGHVLLVLQGEVLSINRKCNTAQVIKELLNKEAAVAKQAGGAVAIFRGRSATALVGLPAMLSPQISTIEDLQKAADSEDIDSGRKMANVLIGPGSLAGSDYYCVRNAAVRSRTYLVSAPSVIGYIPFAALDALFRVDPRFQRVYWRNYYMLIINWVKFSVPFLMDMDDWSQALLSCKLSMIGVNAGEVIKQQGAPSDYAYILLGGAAKVLPDMDGNAPSEREIKRGELFGVMALTTNQPYFHSVVATEPCLVLRLSKRVLDQIYYNNKAKLCEIRIRLMGVNVDLLHAIDHPKGGDLFLQYLTRERAAENLTFYRAVDKFDAMCKQVLKQHALCRKLVERYHEERLNAAALRDHLAAYSSPSPQGEYSEGPGDTASLLLGDTERLQHGEMSVYSLASSAAVSAAFQPPTRLPTIVSVSNLPTSTTSANNSSKEEDGLKPYSVKLKPSSSARHRAIPAMRQSSFSSRVAIALSEEHEQEAEGDGVELASSVVSDGDQGGAGASAADTPSELPSPAGEIAEEAALPSTALASESAVGAAVPGGDESVSKDEAPRKKKYHRSSFLKAKSQDTSARAHEYAEITGRVTSLGGSQAGSSFRSTVLPADAAKTDERAPPQAERSLARVNRHINQILVSILELKQVARNIMETFIHNGADNQLNLPGAMRVRCELQYNKWYTDQGPQSAILGMMNLGAASSDTSELSLQSYSSATPKVAGARQSSSMSDAQVSVIFRTAVLGSAQSATIDTSLVGPADTRGSPGFHSFALRDAALSGTPTFFPADTDKEGATALAIATADAPTAAQGFADLGVPNNPVASATPAPAPLIPLDSIDLSFVDLFKEAKHEILKLLRDDKFPRWKATKEFQNFITSVRPYGDKDSDRHATLDRKSDLERSFDRSMISVGTK